MGYTTPTPIDERQLDVDDIKPQEMSRSSTQGEFSDEEIEDEDIQDWSTLTAVKRGNKDLEPLLSLEDTTKLSVYDQKKLNKARNMRFTALQGKRGLIVNMSNIQQSIIYINLADLNDLFMINPKGKFLETMGDIDRYNVCHLTFEEVVYLVERGSCLAKLYHTDAARNEIYQTMPPLSLQMVYSILILNDEMLNQYMVYSILKRDGYVVSRHEEFSGLVSNIKREVIRSSQLIQQNLNYGWWMKLLSRISSFFYFDLPLKMSFSYLNIYKYLHSKVMPQNISTKKRNKPIKEYNISYNVWRPTGTFKKKNKPLPDFQISIIKATERLPSYNEILSLFERAETNGVIPVKRKSGKQESKSEKVWKYNRGINMNALKQSHINITLAVVDNSLVNFLTLSDCSFAAEGPVWRDHWSTPVETKRKPKRTTGAEDTSKLLKIDTIDKIKRSMPYKSRSTPNLPALERPGNG